MVETFLPYYILGSVLTIIGQLVIWVFCLLLLIKERNWATILLFTGSTLFSLAGVSGTFLQVVFAKTTPELLLKYQGMVYIMTSGFYLVFVTGLVLFFLKYFKVSRLITGTSER